jgi:hypothetical protein
MSKSPQEYLDYPGLKVFPIQNTNAIALPSLVATVSWCSNCICMQCVFQRQTAFVDLQTSRRRLEARVSTLCSRTPLPDRFPDWVRCDEP